MRNIAIVSGTMLLLGLTTQAHAGKYNLVPIVEWKLASSSVGASSAQGRADGLTDHGQQTDSQGATFKYEWKGRNANDFARPATVTLGVTSTVGDCSCSGSETTFAASYAWGQFSFGTGTGSEVSGASNVASGQTPVPKKGATAIGSISKLYGAGPINPVISDAVRVATESNALATDPNSSSSAGGASAKFTSIGIVVQ